MKDERPSVQAFARFVLEKEHLAGWKVTRANGIPGFCSKKDKEIQLGDGATYGIVLHEIAHAIDKNPPTKDGHWGHHTDLLHGLVDKYMIVPNYSNYIDLD